MLKNIIKLLNYKFLLWIIIIQSFAIAIFMLLGIFNLPSYSFHENQIYKNYNEKWFPFTILSGILLLLIAILVISVELWFNKKIINVIVAFFALIFISAISLLVIFYPWFIMWFGYKLQILIFSIIIILGWISAIILMKNTLNNWKNTKQKLTLNKKVKDDS